MKISNETKVGILAIAGLTVLILGFNFLKGKNVFKKTRHIYAKFGNLGSLEKSNEVRINGLPVGAVADRRELDKDVSAIVVTINLSRDINIPKNSVAYISSDLVGASYIVIERGNSTELLKIGDTLRTIVQPGILGEVKAQLSPTLFKVREVLDSLKSTLSGANAIFSESNKRNIMQTIENLNRASSSINGLVDAQTGPLAATLNNAKDVTGDFKEIAAALKKNTDNIAQTIANAKTASEKLAALQLQPTIDSLNSMISQLKATAAKLSSSDGTLGALINDRALYNKLNDAILAAEILMDDLRTNPKRYVNLSIFGRKDKDGPISSPARKDTVPK